MPLRKDSRNQGFILLVALWLVLLAGLLGAVISLNGYRSAHGARVDQDVMQRRLAVESAINSVLYDLIVQGARSRWAHSGTTGILNENGLDVSVKVTNEAGRLDINSASFEQIELVLESAGLEDADRIAAIAVIDEKRRLDRPASRRFGSFGELLSLPGVSGEVLSCLLPLITLYTGQDEPALQWSPEPLLALLAIDPERGAHQSIDDNVIEGNVYRIETKIFKDNIITHDFRIVRLSRAAHQPVWTYPAGSYHLMAKCGAKIQNGHLEKPLASGGVR